MSYHEYIYDMVTKLKKKHKTSNPQDLIEALNIMILPTPTTKLLGMYTVIKRKRIILISDRISYLTNVVLAHELGHDQLHRDECTHIKSFHEHRLFDNTGRLELEANIFAAHLLIEDEPFIDMIKSDYSHYEIIEEFQITPELFNLKVKELAELDKIDVDLSRVIIPPSDYLKYYRPDDSDDFLD